MRTTTSPSRFSPRELIARLRAVMRRGTPREASSGRTRIELGGVILDRERHEVRVEGNTIPFTRAEFRLLWTLVSRPGRVYTRDELVERITDGEAMIIDRNVDVHVELDSPEARQGHQAHRGPCEGWATSATTDFVFSSRFFWKLYLSSTALVLLTAAAVSALALEQTGRALLLERVGRAESQALVCRDGA